MSVRPHRTKHKRYSGETWWTVDVGRDEGRQLISFEGTYVEAKELENEYSADSSEAIGPSAPIKDFVIPFLEWYENEVAARTLKDMNDTIDLYIIEHFGKLRPSQLTHKVINNFKTALLEDGLKPITINKHLNYLSSMLKWAANNVEGCQGLKVDIKRFPKKKTTSPQVVPLNKRQVDAIYKHIQPHFRLLFMLMADQGLRVHEAVKVEAADVDEENELIHVIGKGNRPRQVPYLSNRFADELQRVLEKTLDGYLIINPKTERPYVTILKELERARIKAGIKRAVNHHLLRHSFATHCAERGMNPHALQKILGHASIETTNKIYTNVSKDFVGDEARRLRGLK